MELQQDLLSDIHDELDYEEVSAGTRFLDYIIDLIIFYILSFAAAYIFVAILPLTNTLVGILFNYALYLVYYTFIEGATGGKTIGKMLTGSVAVRDDNTPFTWNDALMRSLSRLVPFEPFSALNAHPWHDTWTNTKVVKYKKIIAA